MVRPTKPRQVEQIPKITYFKPAGVPIRQLEEIVLSIEELEALRLKDSEGLHQEMAAIKMKISRPTFQRILTMAREKVSRALTRGMAIRVEGGTYRMRTGRYRCRFCGGRMQEESKKIQGENCPHCMEKELETELVEE